MSAYRLTTAPRHAGMKSWPCSFCRYEELTRPVFLAGPGGVVAAGSRCAAVALGLVSSRASGDTARRALAPHLDALREAEAAQRRAQAARADADWDAFLARHAPGLERLAQIRQLGGITAARALYQAEAASPAEKLSDPAPRIEQLGMFP